MAKTPFELSVVIPCLNEEETIEHCIQRALDSFRSEKINGEIIVADNGSIDRSKEIAQQLGARVVPVPKKGYGHALMGGIEAAESEFIIMGDADGSYDFGESGNFLRELKSGKDLVMGCRLPSGGGTIQPGAMPFLHRWLGNPLFSFIARTLFRTPCHDVYCGLRGFRRSLYDRLKMRCAGMEFAVEMVVKSALLRVPTSEIPITLHPDLRNEAKPHLRTFRDGWRTARYFILSSPDKVCGLPGIIAFVIGLVGYGLALPMASISTVTFSIHTLLCASLAFIFSVQALTFWIISERLGLQNKVLVRKIFPFKISGVFTLERLLIAACAFLLAGLGLIFLAFLRWVELDFGSLNYEKTMRLVVPGVMFCVLALQLVTSSLVFAMLNIQWKEEN